MGYKDKLQPVSPESQGASAAKSYMKKLAPVSESEVVPEKPATPSMSMTQKFLEVEKGVVKGAGDTLVGMSRAGSSIANQTAGRLINLASGKGAVPFKSEELGDTLENPESQFSKSTDAALESKNGYQTAGKVAETAGEFLLPVGGGPGKAVAATLKAANDAARVKKAESAVSRVLQNPDTLVEDARSALSSIDTKGIKTYEDLVSRVKEKIGIIASKQDEAYETSNVRKVLDNLSHNITVGGEKVSQNYVRDALDQLKNFYVKTANPADAKRIEQLVTRASDEGLTVKEINQVAREHGTKLNAFNASGELASGLSKQAAENTRAGVKATVRDLFGNNIAKASDRELTKLIRVKDDAENMAREVQKLSNKIMDRTLGERAGRLVGQVINLAGMNGPKGLIEYFLGRGTGLKTLNALDLQKQLSKNLKLIQKAADPAAAEKDIVVALEQFIKNMTGKAPMLQLPEKTLTKAASDPLFVPQGGNAISKSLQEAADAAGASSGRIARPGSAVPPKPYKAPKGPKPPLYDPYAPEGVIEYGQKPKAKRLPLPVIR